MKVTRTLQANIPDGLAAICKTMGFVRADIWRRFGALGCIGKNANAIRKTISAANLYGALPVDGTIYHVQFDDWMYLVTPKVMINKAQMSKFGINLGEVTLSFYKR